MVSAHVRGRWGSPPQRHSKGVNWTSDFFIGARGAQLNPLDFPPRQKAGKKKNTKSGQYCSIETFCPSGSWQSKA
jgi:hypothetical protein